MLKTKKFFINLMIFSLLLFNSYLIWAQGTEEFQWIWGEVISVDTNNKQINIKYFDYETDTEKEMLISIDENTTYEGVNSLLEIKPEDTVSIDYVIKDNKNIARLITIEKPQDTATEATPKKEDLPTQE
ncbi:MAG: hypothetical protein NC900_05110 [Candidatus Omnitrophica bacterium]|nr:hypothetical protein [Candidatus Omnitrophota bacterium]